MVPNKYNRSLFLFITNYQFNVSLNVFFHDLMLILLEYLYSIIQLIQFNMRNYSNLIQYYYSNINNMLL